MRTDADPKNLFAFLVGISDYPPPVGRLGGCVRDVEAFEQYLRHRVNGRSHRLQIRVLKDREATRDAVIEGFRKHLGQAGPGDSAVLFFAGHGSQQPSPPEFWEQEPDRLDETILCYDSRLRGGKDLADKELAALIGEVSVGKAHVTVILDCCHSGSGTRDASNHLARNVPPRLDVRAISTYLGYENGTMQTFRTGTSGWAIGAESRHVLLAACRDYERAWEQTDVGGLRGLFSLSLIQALEECPGVPTYRSLFQGVQARVLSRRSDQNPQLEAAHSHDLAAPFLGGAAAAHPARLSVTRHGTSDWRVSFGAVHGMPPPDDKIPVRLALFPQGTSAVKLAEPQFAVGSAYVSEVFSSFSSVELDFDPGSASAFEASLAELPVPAARVAFAGDPAGVAAAKQEMQHSGPGGVPSPFLIGDQEGASLILTAFEDRYEIHRKGENIPLTDISRSFAGAEQIAIERLEHIACWYQVATGLTNPYSSITETEFEVTILHDGRDVAQSGGLIEYRDEGGKWIQPGIKIKVVNLGDRPLYFALLALSEAFKISALMPVGAVRLDPRQEAYANGGGMLYSSVPAAWLKNGATEVLDVIKTIVSTSEFDARLLERHELERPATRGVARERTFASTSLNLLMHRIGTRTISDAPESLDDWKAVNIMIRTVRPRSWTTLGPDSGAALGFGVLIGPHPTFSARIRLSSEPQAGRAIGSRLRPSLLFHESEENKVLRFTCPRGNDPGLSVLDLTTLLQPEQITPRDPLVMRTEISLQPGERILPFAFDGEFYLPLGRSQTCDGLATVLIEHLPAAIDVDSDHRILRSPGGTVRILFQKLSTSPGCSPATGPSIVLAETGLDGKPSYDREIGNLRNRLAEAEGAWLLMPGRLGTGRGMVEWALEFAGRCPVLVFEGESGNPEMDADLLKDQLALVGVTATWGPRLLILNYALAGPTGHWFVERDSGRAVSPELVIFGTPHTEWPLGDLNEWATVVGALALNRMMAEEWTPRCLVDVLEAAANGLQVSFPGSPCATFIPHTVARGKAKQERDLLCRLFRSLGLGQSQEEACLEFFSRPNDFPETATLAG